MRKIYAKSNTFTWTLMFALLFISFITGCKATPKTEIIVSKGDGKLGKIILGAPAKIKKPYEAPGSLEYRLDDIENFAVEVDAPIIVPDVDAYPVVGCKRNNITQREANRIMDALLQGEPIYMPSEELTKAQVDNSIKYYRKKLETIPEEEVDSELKQQLKEAAGGHGVSDELSGEELAQLYKGKIKELIELYESAPNGVELDPSDTKFGYVGWTEDEIERAKVDGRMDIVGVTSPESDRRQMGLTIHNSYQDNYSQVYFEPYEIDGLTYPHSSVDRITLDQAIARAEQLVEEMNLDFSIVHAYTSTFIEESGEPIERWHELKLKRNIYGAPQGDAYTVPQISQTEYDYSYEGEYIVIGIDDDGLKSFIWENPSKLAHVENSNVPLLEFEEVKEIFDRQILIQNQWGYPHREIISRCLVIDRIELSYMLIQRGGYEDEYIYIPVWDFYGELIAKYEEDYPSGEEGYLTLDENNERVEIGKTEERLFVTNNSFLTINAIDGSIIDRNLGY